MRRGEFARAAEQFKKVLSLDPDLPEAEINLGLAYQSLYEYDVAVRHLTKGLRERPSLVGPTVIVGMDYLKLALRIRPFRSSSARCSSTLPTAMPMRPWLCIT
jgi:tetratricopeptide (TPR) repeat protein